MSHPLKLALDLDGVFADFNGQPDSHGFAKVLVETTKKNLFPKPFAADTWNWWTALGYRKSEADMAWKYVDASAYFWSGLQPLPGAVAALASIQFYIDKKLAQVVFLTTRNSPTAHWQSVEWLQQHGIHRPQVCICHNSHSKAQVARALQVHAIVDDYVHNLKAVQMHSGDTIKRFLVRQPYNVGLDHECGGGVRVIDNLTQLVELIDHLTLSK